MIETEEHIILVFIRPKQCIGEIIEKTDTCALIRYNDIDEWFDKEEYFVWQNMVFNYSSDEDEII